VADGKTLVQCFGLFADQESGRGLEAGFVVLLVSSDRRRGRKGKERDFRKAHRVGVCSRLEKSMEKVGKMRGEVVFIYAGS
jgi:hypothetical protein